MIKLGIIGLGNVALSVHLPILKSRKDIKIEWVCDKSKLANDICERINIPFYHELDEALSFICPEIVLITTPYNTREAIFKKIKNRVKGVYCEKPFALSTKEHLNYISGYEKYAFTIGYQRRSLGNVQILRNIIENKLFGAIKEILIQFGDVHYSFDGFRSEKNIAGGGILFESGSHWIDSVLYISNALDLDNFSSDVKYLDNLDIHGEGKFNIHNSKNEKIDCKFIFSSIKNTSNKITIVFENFFIDLYLYQDNSNLIIQNLDSRRFYLSDFNLKNYPNDSISQGTSYWENFLKSYKEKKQTFATDESFYLTTKFIEFYYAK